MQNLKGFTLIELLVVVIILGILAATAIPRFISAIDKAKCAEAVNMCGAIREASIRYYSERGAWPSLNNQLDISFDSSKYFSYNFGGGAVNCVVKNNVSINGANNATLSLSNTSVWGGTLAGYVQ